MVLYISFYALQRFSSIHLKFVAIWFVNINLINLINPSYNILDWTIDFRITIIQKVGNIVSGIS